MEDIDGKWSAADSAYTVEPFSFAHCTALPSATAEKKFAGMGVYRDRAAAPTSPDGHHVALHNFTRWPASSKKFREKLLG
jgi:hypothetical protein